MLSRKAKIVGLVIALVMLFAGGTIGVWPTASLPLAAADSKVSNLKGLFEERRAILQAIASQIAEDYRAGHASFAQVHEASQAVHKAELDQCDSDKERSDVLKKMLELAKANELHADTAYKAAKTPISTALKAKVDRLEVEITLERLLAK